MRILVTGGTGFIGARAVERFLLDEANAVYFSGRREPVGSPLIKSGAHFLKGDLSNENYGRSVSNNMDVIVHCAGLAGTWGEYDQYYQANVVATKNLLEGAKQNGVRRIINISSPSIYFDFKDQLNLKEGDLPPKFSNSYAKTKYEAEMLMQSYHSKDLKTVSLRPRSVIGRGDQNVLPRLITLQKSGSLVKVGNGQNVVDITSVENLLDAIELCIQAPDTSMGEVYNITNGRPIRFWDFVAEVLRKAGLESKPKKVPYLPVMIAARINEALSKLIHRKAEPAFLPISVGIITFSMTMDISKAKSKLGYTPRQTTSAAIDEFLGLN